MECISLVIFILILFIYITIYFGKNSSLDLVVIFGSLFIILNKKKTNYNQINTVKFKGSNNQDLNQVNNLNNQVNNKNNKINNKNNKTININREIIKNTEQTDIKNTLSDSTMFNNKQKVLVRSKINDFSKGDNLISNIYKFDEYNNYTSPFNSDIYSKKDENIDYTTSIIKEGKVDSLKLTPINNPKFRNTIINNISSEEMILDEILNPKENKTGDQRFAERSKFQGKKDMQSNYYRKYKNSSNIQQKLFKEELQHYNGGTGSSVAWWENDENDFK